MPMPSQFTWRLPATQTLKISMGGMFSRPLIPSTLEDAAQFQFVDPFS